MAHRIPRLFPRADPLRSWLYLLEYESGVVKVGRTSQPDKRMRAHRSRGLLIGQRVKRFHLLGSSHAMHGWWKEHVAIAALEKVATRFGASEEFDGITFEAALKVVRASSAPTNAQEIR